MPHERTEGWRVQEVWTVASTTNAIMELGDRLVCQGVQRVVMEATGTYWKTFFYLLEARGLKCWLVNAREVKNVPGRPKTDKLDAVWLAKLGERGMVRASFVPPKPVRQLRDLTRTRISFTQDRTRHKHHVEKALEDVQIKLSTIVSDLRGLRASDAGRPGRRRAQFTRTGPPGPREPGQEARRAHRAPHWAVRGPPPPPAADPAGHRRPLHHADRELDRRINALLDTMAAPSGDAADSSAPADASGRPGRDLIECLDAIPGVGETTAQTILAEIGLDMSASPSRTTWSPGRSSAPGPSSPERRTPQARLARATLGSRAPWARRPTPPPAPTPSSARATGASSNAEATRRRWSRSHARSSS